MNKLTLNDFVSKARARHGDKYDYSLVDYVNARTKVEIVCPTHGSFWQKANAHITNGHGCPKCGKESAARKISDDRESFVRKAIALHGTKHDYRLVEYVNNHTKVKIDCLVHGVFEQTPNCHLLGQGCKSCAYESRREAFRDTKELFVEKSIACHGLRYDYSLVDYINNNVPVEIICSEHGRFLQRPANHLNGCRCPDCGKTGFKPGQKARLYLVKFVKPYCTFWKIGITGKTPKDRLTVDYSFVKYEKTWAGDGRKVKVLESEILSLFADYRLNDFIFPLLTYGGDTECFSHKLPHKEVIRFIEGKVNSW